MEDQFPKLSDGECEAWSKRLRLQLKDLRERFKQEVLQEPANKLLSLGDDDEVKPAKSLDIHEAVESLMSLAVPINGVPFSPSRKSKPSIPFHSVYSNASFSDPTTQIRLIQLLPATAQDPINVQLFTVNSVKARTFEALSYVWGSSKDAITIMVNGQAFEISASLGSALRCLRPSPAEHSRILWVDSICINQRDDVEKSAQVGMMGSIYRAAENVLIFLGEEANGSGQIMDYLELDAPDATFRAREILDDEDAESKGLKERVENRISQCGHEINPFLLAANSFFGRQWWSRIWVVQEYALAQREPQWYCGRRCVSTKRIKNHLMIDLFDYLQAETAPGSQNTELALAIEKWLDMPARQSNIRMLLESNQETGEWAQLPAKLLMRTLYRQSSDPRDMVYGLRELLEPVSKRVFHPDYSITVEHLFTKVATFLLLLNHFAKIYDCYPLIKSPNSPSWVPNLAKPLAHDGFGALTTCGANGQWSKRFGRLSVYSGILGVSGIELDTVDHVCQLENKIDYMDVLQAFWEFENIIKARHPSFPFPKEADACIPPNCRVPLVNPRQMLGSSGCEVFGAMFPAVLEIPGYVHFAHQLLFSAAEISPDNYPEVHRCSNWQQLRFDVDKYSRYMKIMHLFGDFRKEQNLFASACFDFDNLKKQVDSVTLLGNTQDLAVAGLVAVPPSTPRLTGDAAKLQYSHMKEIMSESRTQEELDEFKKHVMALAEKSRQIINIYSDGNLPTASYKMNMLEGHRKTWTNNVNEYRNIMNTCNCDEATKEEHQSVLQNLIDKYESKCRDPDDSLISALKGIGHDALYPVTETIRRSYTCMFITKRGFIGASFQGGHEICDGDTVALLDGISAPLLLARQSTGESYKAKSPIMLAGVAKMDLDKLLEMGLIQSRDFRIE